jgi:4-hydroxy-tetrahydrodipicolinate synthase
MFKGLASAIVTPFKDGALDLNNFQDLLDWQIKWGVNGVIVCGTTGESTSLTDLERNLVIVSALEACKSRAPIIVGSGSNCTAESIEFSKQAEKLGANGLLVTVPYYNRPSQEGLYRHYKAINDNVGIPIIIYNNPVRSAVGLSDETIVRLSKLPNIKGLKDSTGDLARPVNLKMLLKNDPDFMMVTGEDQTSVAFNSSGGVGIISITGNIAPELCARIQNASLNNNYQEALSLQLKLFILHKAMVCETNPVPIKFALSLLGKITEEVRLPLVGLRVDSKIIVRKAMEELGII